jgi:preprotein translocase subunit SecD
VYEGPKGTAIRVATVTFYSNTPTVFCLIYNPAHFKRYTEANIYHTIGLVIDNKVVYSATLMTPISNALALYGPDITNVGANFLVAIINSGPLPDGVHLSKL